MNEEDADATEVTVLAAVGGKYGAWILCAADEPVSAQTLSDTLDIPIATCYRRIEELVEAGMLESHGRTLSAEGRRVTVYVRTVDRLAVTFDGDRPAIESEPRPETDGRSLDR